MKIALKEHNSGEIYLIFVYNAVNCYLEVEIFNEVLKEVWDKRLLTDKEEEIKELKYKKEVHKKFWRGKEMKVINI